MKKYRIFSWFTYTVLGVALALLSGCLTSGSESSTETKVLKAVVLNSGEIPVNSTLVIEFSEEIDASTITASSVYLLDGSGSKVDVSFGMADTIHLMVKPGFYMKPNSSYRLVLTTDIKSVNALSFTQNYEWQFTTGAQVDSEGPKLRFVLPADYETIDVLTTVGLQFDEALIPDGVDNLTLKNSKGELVAGSAREADSTLRFVPDQVLVMGETYTLTLEPGVSDYAGNLYTGTTSWSFTINSESAMTGGGTDPLTYRLDLAAKINSIVTKDNLLYVCTTGKLFVVEPHSDGTMQILKSMAFDTDIYDIAIGSDVSALATYHGVILIDTGTLGTLALVEFGAPVYGVAYNDKHFYAAVSSEGLYVIDLNDNSVNAIETDGTAFDVLVNGDDLYVAKYLGGVGHYTLSGQHIEDYPTGIMARSLDFNNNRLFVSGGIEGMAMVDVQTKESTLIPVLAYGFQSSVSVESTGEYLYFADKERGVGVYDIAANEPFTHIRDIALDNGTKIADNTYAISLVSGMLITGSKEGTLVSYSLVSDMMDQNTTPILPSVDTNTTLPTDTNTTVPADTNTTVPTDTNTTLPTDTNTTPLPDITPPFIVASVPANDEIFYTSTYAGDINITFSEDINVSTINNTNVKIYRFDEGGSTCNAIELNATLTYDANSKVLNIMPGVTLYYSQTANCTDPGRHEVHIDGIQDLAGNTMAAQVITFFIDSLAL